MEELENEDNDVHTTDEDNSTADEVGEIEALPIYFDIGTTVVLNNEVADPNLSESGKLKHNYEVDKNVCK